MGHSIEEVLSALNAASVRYLVVGGVAVVLHGYLRTTADLDLVIDLSAENAGRAARALMELGYEPRIPLELDELVDPVKRASWAAEKGLEVLPFWSERLPRLEVDVFIGEPLDFEAAYARAVRVDLDTTEAMVVSLPDLIAMKQATGRPIDKVDIEALRQLAVEGDA